MDTPPPLRPVAGIPRVGTWFEQHAVGLGALILGALAFVVATLQQSAVWASPDWRITVPFFIVTLIVAVVSFARREGTPALALLGVGLAAATIALGWFLILAAVVAVTAVLILIMSVVM